MNEKLLVVIDMQNDFVSGSLANPKGREIADKIAAYITTYNEDATIVITLDTHFSNYLETQEGKMLPYPHCIKGSFGWFLDEAIVNALKLKKNTPIQFEKETFGSIDLALFVSNNGFKEVELCGLVSSICVISNALLIKVFSPEIKITVKKDLTYGLNEEDYQASLRILESCQVILE